METFNNANFVSCCEESYDEGDDVIITSYDISNVDINEFNKLVWTKPVTGRTSYGSEHEFHSWYHPLGSINGCATTVFEPSGHYCHNISDKVIIAYGSYKGVKGRWYLYRSGNMPKAVYQK